MLDRRRLLLLRLKTGSLLSLCLALGRSLITGGCKEAQGKSRPRSEVLDEIVLYQKLEGKIYQYRRFIDKRVCLAQNTPESVPHEAELTVKGRELISKFVMTTREVPEGSYRTKAMQSTYLLVILSGGNKREFKLNRTEDAPLAPWALEHGIRMLSLIR